MDPERAALEHVGQTVAHKYRLLGLLGVGGMGAVYEAEHVFTKRRVALKRMHPGIAKSKLAAERFVRESQAPSSIGHPGIVQVLDGGFESDGASYLVLELLEGVSMRDALDEDALQPEQIVQIGVELLEALVAAHAKGFTHRDIKPDNIFLAHDGRGGVSVKLLDFGIASLRETETDAKLTQTGAVLGTPLYMSPEQATGERIDARSDLWSVGALLYRALAGTSPFEGESYNALIVSIVTQDHLPLSERRDDLPSTLYAVVEGALRKRPQQRFQSASEMLDALRSVSFAAARGPLERRSPSVVTRGAAPARTASLRPGFSRWVFGAAASGALALASYGVLRPERGKPSSEPVALAAASPAAGRAMLPPSVFASSAESEGTSAARGPAADPPQQPTAADVRARPNAPVLGPPPQPLAAGLAGEQVAGVLAAQQAQMQSCLQEAVVAQMLAGAAEARPLRLDIELKISPSGRVVALSTEGAVPAELERCVRTRLHEAVFPAAALATVFRYPLIFQSTIVGQ